MISRSGTSIPSGGVGPGALLAAAGIDNRAQGQAWIGLTKRGGSRALTTGATSRASSINYTMPCSTPYRSSARLARHILTTDGAQLSFLDRAVGGGAHALPCWREQVGYIQYNPRAADHNVAVARISSMGRWFCVLIRDDEHNMRQLDRFPPPLIRHHLHR